MDATGHLLLVDDDERLRNLLQRYLTSNGYVITTTAAAGDAERSLGVMAFDLIILDVMLPDLSGLELARKLRLTNNVPILLLTAKGEVADRIAGLEAGADDYLVKPFEPRELLLRIATILRRTQIQSDSNLIRFGPFEFNIASGELRRDDLPVHLTTGELALLRILAEKFGNSVSRLEIANGTGTDGSDRAVDVQVTRLRRKIESDPRQPVHLLTVRGEGYVLRAAGI